VGLGSFTWPPGLNDTPDATERVRQERGRIGRRAPPRGRVKDVDRDAGGVSLPSVLHDRLTGVLCLGAATVAATWGGNGVLHHASAEAAKGRHPAVHADAVVPGPLVSDTGPPPAPDPSSTSTTTPPSSTTTGTAGGATTTSARPGEAPTALAQRALLVQTDVPAGFTVTSPAPPAGSAPPDSPLERCVGPDAGSLTAAIGARARSATFAKPDTGSVSSAAVVFD
jgi:hypothetical protein